MAVLRGGKNYFNTILKKGFLGSIVMRYQGPVPPLSSKKDGLWEIRWLGLTIVLGPVTNFPLLPNCSSN